MQNRKREYILATPVFNSEGLRAGSIVRFFLERSATYPARCSDKPVCPSIFLGPEVRSLPSLKVPTHKGRLDSKRLASILNAEIAAFVLVWPSCQYGLTANYANVQAMLPLVDLIRWTISTYIHNGEGFVASRLKLFCAWARYKAGEQLHLSPGNLSRFPFCDDNGVPDFRKFFIGSIADKASSAQSLFRLSRMSRAFPPGDKIVQDQALIDHKSLMVANFRTPAVLLSAFSKVVSKISKDSFEGVEKPGITLSNSSCWERGRKRGGAAEEITSTLLAHYPLVQYMSYLPDSDLERHIKLCRGEGSDDDLDDLLMGVAPEGLPHEVGPVIEMTYRSCVEEEFPNGAFRRLAKHRVLPVPDRGGFKVRVITAGESRLQCLAQNVRKVVYRNILKKTPSKWSLVQDGVLHFLRQLRKPQGTDADALGDWVVLSCDMKSATDRFPHDVVEIMNDSLESNMTQEQRVCPNWVAWRMLSGPQLLRYPDDKEDDPLLITTCGNLMGTAPSWVHLNLFNLTLIRTAWSMWSSKRWREMLSPVINRGKICDFANLDTGLIREKILLILSDKKFNAFVFPKSWKFNNITCIVGDDLGAVCPFPVAVVYEILLELCNGRTSFGKHYVQPWKDGSYMLLAEDWSIVKNDCMVVQPCESLRGIVAATHQYDSRQAMPAWHQIGTTLTASVNRVRKSARKAVCSLGHIALSDWRSSLIRMGLPVYLPASVGGLGWPHPRGLEYGLDRLSVQTRLAYRVLRGFRQDPIAFAFKILELRSSWLSTERNSAYSNLLRTMKSYFTSFRVAHNVDGSLAPLDGEDYIIGLVPTRWAVLAEEGSRCRKLIDVIDQLVMHGLPVGYMCENISLTFDKPYREASLAAKRFSRCCNNLIAQRRSHDVDTARGSELARRIREDEELLDSLYIYIGDSFEDVFPKLASVVLESII